MFQTSCLKHRHPCSSVMINCASNQKHCKFTADLNLKSVITLLILNSSFSVLIFSLHLWFPLKSTFYLEISRFTCTISGTVHCTVYTILYSTQGRSQDLCQGGKPLSVIIGEIKHGHLINPHKSEFYPNISTLLQIFTTLPCTTATEERSFSTLRRISRFLRSGPQPDLRP